MKKKGVHRHRYSRWHRDKRMAVFETRMCLGPDCIKREYREKGRRKAGRRARPVPGFLAGSVLSKERRAGRDRRKAGR